MIIAAFRKMRTWISPLLAMLIFVSVWHVYVTWADVSAMLLPGPLQVVRACWVERFRLLQAAGITLGTAMMGLVAAIGSGTVVSVIFAQSRAVRLACFPYAIFLQTVPIVAVAPIVVTWLGEGTPAVATIAFIVSLFPMITNGTAGMLATPSDLIDLFRINGARRWQFIWKLQLPSALPYLITGAKISSGLSVLGAIVGEYFAGAGSQNPGLGYLIFVAKGQYRMDFLFAAVLTCTILGVTCFSAIDGLSRHWLLRWQDHSK